MTALNSIKQENIKSENSSSDSSKAVLKRKSSVIAVKSPKKSIKTEPKAANTAAANNTKKAIKKAELVDEAEMKEIISRAMKTRRWVGAHVGASGGVHMAVANSMRIGGAAMALFLKSQRRWESPPLSEEIIIEFKKLLKATATDPKFILPHGSYLINLGNPDKEKRIKSYGAFLDDLKRCEALGIKLYNFHPGSSLKQCTVEESIEFIAEHINDAHKDTDNVCIVLENTAGQGGTIGRTFEELASIIKLVRNKQRIGVCLDTCHAFAAGYDLRTFDSFSKVMDDFEAKVGLQYLKGLHLNDSKAPYQSNRDRHENLGKGMIGLDCFKFIMTDKRFENIPMVLETPNEGSDGKEDMMIWKKEIDLLYSFCS